MNALLLKKIEPRKDIVIELPASKSISNRLLILSKLSNGKVTGENLSDARDTQHLITLLESDAETLDVIDAGTSMRFLCAYCCAANRASVITGSERMMQRTIQPLVDALLAIGFDVCYENSYGFPPVRVRPLKDFSALAKSVKVKGDVSSQFITALLLIAPVLPKGLSVEIIPPVASQPYISITLAMLKKVGVKILHNGNSINIAPQQFQRTHFVVEPDWTNAFYWFSLCALLPDSSFLLRYLSLETLQGDANAVAWMQLFGVRAEQLKNGLKITHEQFQFPGDVQLHFNFEKYPDLAQTFMVLCASKNINATFSGLQSLRIKETDRIAAMQQELKKCGVRLVEKADELFELQGKFHQPAEPIETHNDHRMAMAFAPLAALGSISISSPWVVEKSYPSFWKQMEKCS